MVLFSIPFPFLILNQLEIFAFFIGYATFGMLLIGLTGGMFLLPSPFQWQKGLRFARMSLFSYENSLESSFQSKPVTFHWSARWKSLLVGVTQLRHRWYDIIVFLWTRVRLPSVTYISIPATLGEVLKQYDSTDVLTSSGLNGYRFDSFSNELFDAFRSRMGILPRYSKISRADRSIVEGWKVGLEAAQFIEKPYDLQRLVDWQFQDSNTKEFLDVPNILAELRRSSRSCDGDCRSGQR
jgi:hypothetical protein